MLFYSTIYGTRCIGIVTHFEGYGPSFRCWVHTRYGDGYHILPERGFILVCPD